MIFDDGGENRDHSKAHQLQAASLPLQLERHNDRMLNNPASLT
jgi:hypothetical protein